MEERKGIIVQDEFWRAIWAILASLHTEVTLETQVFNLWFLWHETIGSSSLLIFF